QLDVSAGVATAAAFSPDGASVMVGGRDHLARICDVATGRVVDLIGPFSDPVSLVAFPPEGMPVITAGSLITVWSPRPTHRSAESAARRGRIPLMLSGGQFVAGVEHEGPRATVPRSEPEKLGEAPAPGAGQPPFAAAPPPRRHGRPPRRLEATKASELDEENMRAPFLKGQDLDEARR